MAETIDELTIHYEEDGKVLRKQIAKEVLSKGSWTTIMFLYRVFVTIFPIIPSEEEKGTGYAG